MLILTFQQALQVLNKVDQTIIVTHYAQVLSVSSSAQLTGARNEVIRRLLEIVDILSVEDGEKYAREIKHLLKHLEDTSTAEGRPILDSGVDMIITHIRSCKWLPWTATLILNVVSRRIIQGGLCFHTSDFLVRSRGALWANPNGSYICTCY